MCLAFLVVLAARVSFVRISAAPDNLLMHTENGREIFSHQRPSTGPIYQIAVRQR